MARSANVAIGIDFGTSKACVAVFCNRAAEVIEDEEGNRTTPTYVAFTDRGRLIGREAKNQAALDPDNTVYDVHRLLGRKFSDVIVEKDDKHWPFKLINHDGWPLVEVQVSGQTKTFRPEEICAMILARMKQIALNHLGDVACAGKAVISIPSIFNFRQRQALMDAAKIADLNVLSLVNSPSLAAMNYVLEKNITESRQVVVFDLGSGALNVATVNVGDQVNLVASTAGNSDIGGDDFDNRMVTHFLGEIRKNQKRDVSGDKRVLRRLRSACERAKRDLSVASQAHLEIDNINFCSSISRPTFEQLADDCFRAILQPVEKALTEARWIKSEVDDVLLVGGSSRIPRIQTILQEFFDGKRLAKSVVNPDEAVAKGAAIQAALLIGDNSVKQLLLLLDVTPLTLGIESPSGRAMLPIIKRNSNFPTKLGSTFSTHADNQTVFEVKAYAGEKTIARDNEFLCSFELANLPPSPAGVLEIDVIFDVDPAFTVIEIVATEQSTGRQKKMTAKRDGFYSNEDIERMKKDARKYLLEDNRLKERQQARNNLDEYILLMKKTIANEKLRGHIDSSERSQVAVKCDEAQSWLDANQQAKLEEIKLRQKELEHYCDPVIRKACQKLLGIF